MMASSEFHYLMTPLRVWFVLLKLLHFQFEQPKMTPALLMQIALLADKYDMATGILYWSRLWCFDLKDSIPSMWRPEVIPYIGSFSMLKMYDRRDNMENLARGYVTETTSAGELPIHGIIGESLDWPCWMPAYNIESLQQNDYLLWEMPLRMWWIWWTSIGWRKMG